MIMKDGSCLKLFGCFKFGYNIQSHYIPRRAISYTRDKCPVKLQTTYVLCDRKFTNPLFRFPGQSVCLSSLYTRHFMTTSHLCEYNYPRTMKLLHLKDVQQSDIHHPRFYSLSVNCFQANGQYHYTHKEKSNSKASYVLYFSSILVFMVGLAYAAVPLYRIFCQATGLGGDPKLGHKIDKVGTMEPIRARKIHVSFNADHHASMQWNFKPSQKVITVVPGETALAFYTAKNPTDKPIVGIATYNVVPFQAGLYFNKIQCFCFEEQWLNPNEEVDMPVFFYIDPDYDDDPQLANTDDIILSYTFFKAEEGQTLPLPGFMKANSVVNLNTKSE